MTTLTVIIGPTVLFTKQLENNSTFSEAQKCCQNQGSEEHPNLVQRIQLFMTRYNQLNYIYDFEKKNEWS